MGENIRQHSDFRGRNRRCCSQRVINTVLPGILSDCRTARFISLAPCASLLTPVSAPTLAPGALASRQRQSRGLNEAALVALVAELEMAALPQPINAELRHTWHRCTRPASLVGVDGKLVKARIEGSVVVVTGRVAAVDRDHVVCKSWHGKQGQTGDDGSDSELHFASLDAERS